jgi:hypothetical protein
VGERGRYTAEVAGSSPAPPTIIFLGLLREPEIRSISAVTLATRGMAGAVHFDEALGFPMAYEPKSRGSDRRSSPDTSAVRSCRGFPGVSWGVRPALRWRRRCRRSAWLSPSRSLRAGDQCAGAAPR